jgi:hypothetical protein
MTPQIESIAKQINTQFIEGLGDIKLTPAEAEIVAKASLTVATNAVQIIGLDPDNVQTHQGDIHPAIASLAPIGLAYDIDAEGEFVSVASHVLSGAFEAASQHIAQALVVEEHPSEVVEEHEKQEQKTWPGKHKKHSNWNPTTTSSSGSSVSEPLPPE